MNLESFESWPLDLQGKPLWVTRGQYPFYLHFLTLCSQKTFFFDAIVLKLEDDVTALHPKGHIDVQVQLRLDGTSIRHWGLSLNSKDKPWTFRAVAGACQTVVVLPGQRIQVEVQTLASSVQGHLQGCRQGTVEAQEVFSTSYYNAAHEALLSTPGAPATLTPEKVRAILDCYSYGLISDQILQRGPEGTAGTFMSDAQIFAEALLEAWKARDAQRLESV